MHLVDICQPSAIIDARGVSPMNTYEVTYITQPIEEALEEALLEHDVNVGCHSGLHFVMASLVTGDFQTAAEELAKDLKGRGVPIERMELDLVNQSGIAIRCDKSRQAVGKWVQCRDNPFPKPYAVVSGPLWAWSDVNEWLRRTGKDCYEDACSANPAQVDAFNAAWRAASWSQVEAVHCPRSRSTAGDPAAA